MKNLFSYCEKGDGAANEDICGSVGQFAWVIDGATDVFEKHCLGEENEVSVYVKYLNDAISEIADRYQPQQLQLLVKEAVSLVYNRLNFTEKAAGLSEYMLPTFALAVASIKDETLYYLVLGDCFIGYMEDCSFEVITDYRISDFSKYNRLLLKKIYEETKQIPVSKEIYQETRAKANAPQGYPIGSVCGTGIEKALTGAIQLRKGQRFIICSDGFLDYVKGNGVNNQRLFYTHSLVQEIEKMNRFLSDEQQYYSELRPKKIDDRTILLLEV